MRLKIIIKKEKQKQNNIISFLFTTLSSPRTNPPNKAIKSAALTSSCPYILGQIE
jgi:hypothetical protein